MLWTVFGKESHWMYKQPLINCDMPGNIPQLTGVCFIVCFYCLGEAERINPDRSVEMATPLLMESLHLLWELNCKGSGKTVVLITGRGSSLDRKRDEDVVTVLVILHKTHCHCHEAPTTMSEDMSAGEVRLNFHLWKLESWVSLKKKNDFQSKSHFEFVIERRTKSWERRKICGLHHVPMSAYMTHTWSYGQMETVWTCDCEY